MKNINLSQSSSRREFIKQSSKLGFLCCIGCMGAGGFHKLKAEGMMRQSVPDPKQLNYCGYICPAECPMKAAGLSDDIEKKRTAYEQWRLKERYGLEFDPDQILCNGCKTDQEELGMAVSHCPVRKCAMEKGVDCCIECENLAECDKVLWTEFPDFHKYVLGMREAYLNGE